MIHHVAIKARDVSSVASFYTEVLGFSEKARHHDDAGLRSIWIDCGSSILMIERTATSLAMTETAGLHLIAFSIAREEREAWRERLGSRVVGETEYTLYLRDPEGNRVGLSCWPD